MCVRVLVSTFVYACECVCVRVRVRLRERLRACVCACVHAYVRVQFVYVCVCMCIMCARACLRDYRYAFCLCVCLFGCPMHSLVYTVMLFNLFNFVRAFVYARALVYGVSARHTFTIYDEFTYSSTYNLLFVLLLQRASGRCVNVK